jgi:Tetratrico peptide repeat
MARRQVDGNAARGLSGLRREREAVSHSLTALSSTLPQYSRSLVRYASALAAAAAPP